MPAPGAAPGGRGAACASASSKGEIAPGAKLNERELSESLQVSRTPLREAIKMLAAEGLVELLPNRGAVAAQLSAAGRGRHLRGHRRPRRPCRANWPRSASPTPNWPRSARCTTRCWPPSRGATCPPITGSMRSIHERINAAARNPVLAQTYRTVNARLQALRFRSNFDERKWEHCRAGTRADGRAAGRARWRRACARCWCDTWRTSATRCSDLMQQRPSCDGAGRARMNAAVSDAGIEALKRGAGPDAAELARRLRAETRGEVLFDAAARGRYATDASIYQIDAGRRVRAAQRRTTSRTALAIARELRRAGAVARRRHLAVRPDHRRGAGDRPQQAPAPHAAGRRRRARRPRSSPAWCSTT